MLVHAHVRPHSSLSVEFFPICVRPENESPKQRNRRASCRIILFKCDSVTSRVFIGLFW